MSRTLALLLATAALGCGAPAPDEAPPSLTERGTFHIQVVHDDGSFRRGSNSFRVRAWDAAGAPATLAEAVAVMPSHDHERSVGTINPDGGDFVVDGLLLTMPGNWRITLRVAQGARSDVALVGVFIP